MVETGIEKGTKDRDRHCTRDDKDNKDYGQDRERDREREGRYRIGETEIVGGTGVTQEAGAVAWIARIGIVKMGITRGSMPVVALIPLEGMRRMSRSPRRRRMRRRRVTEQNHPGPETAEANRPFGLLLV